MQKRLLTVLLAAAALPAASGCFGNERTTFPPGFGPLTPNRSSTPPPEGDQMFPEKIKMIRGSTDAYEWVHARAYVHAPVIKVWKALHDPDVDADRRAIDSYTLQTAEGVSPDDCYVIHEVVHDIITVEFDMTWRHKVIQGSKTDPGVFSTRFQKTDGTTTIAILRGSIDAHAVDDNVTELGLVQHIESLGAGAEAVEAYFKDLFANIVAHTRGQPLTPLRGKRSSDRPVAASPSCG